MARARRSAPGSAAALGIGVAIALALAGSVRAAAAPQHPDVLEGGAARGRLRVRWENDSWLSSSDRFYTNGARIGVTLPPGALADAFAGALAGLPLLAPRRTGTATELALGQEIYTPQDIAAVQPVPDDRPYAGWLHVDVRHQVLALDRAHRHDTADTWLLQLGVVGPSSLAEDVQRQVHEVVDAPRPRGWSNQLHDEPGIVLGFRRDLRAFHDDDALLGLASDLSCHWALRLGNVDTSARLGVEARLGLGLPRHFGTTIGHPSLGERCSLFLAAGVEGRGVLRNVFLDGNTFRDSHDVDRNAFVADFHVGVHWEPCARVRFAVTRVFRTPEFDAPSASSDAASFTSVQLEVLW